MRTFRAVLAFYWVFAYKLASTFAQMYMLSLIASNGSSEQPFLDLKTIAHLGAWAAALRGVDALMDPVFQKLNPFKIDEPKPVVQSAEIAVASLQKENP